MTAWMMTRLGHYNNKMIQKQTKILTQVNNNWAQINKIYKVQNHKIIIDCFNKHNPLQIYKITKYNNSIGKFKCLNAVIENYIDK